MEHELLSVDAGGSRRSNAGEVLLHGGLGEPRTSISRSSSNYKASGLDSEIFCTPSKEKTHPELSFVRTVQLIWPSLCEKKYLVVLSVLSLILSGIVIQFLPVMAMMTFRIVFNFSAATNTGSDEIEVFLQWCLAGVGITFVAMAFYLASWSRLQGTFFSNLLLQFYYMEFQRPRIASGNEKTEFLNLRNNVHSVTSLFCETLPGIVLHVGCMIAAVITVFAASWKLGLFCLAYTLMLGSMGAVREWLSHKHSQHLHWYTREEQKLFASLRKNTTAESAKVLMVTTREARHHAHRKALSRSLSSSLHGCLALASPVVFLLFSLYVPDTNSADSMKACFYFTYALLHLLQLGKAVAHWSTKLLEAKVVVSAIHSFEEENNEDVAAQAVLMLHDTSVSNLFDTLEASEGFPSSHLDSLRKRATILSTRKAHTNHRCAHAVVFVLVVSFMVVTVAAIVFTDKSFRCQPAKLECLVGSEATPSNLGFFVHAKQEMNYDWGCGFVDSNAALLAECYDTALDQGVVPSPGYPDDELNVRLQHLSAKGDVYYGFQSLVKGKVEEGVGVRRRLLAYAAAGITYTSYSVDQNYQPKSDYVVYQEGCLPIILSAPHGGSLEPDGFPDRKHGYLVNGECQYSEANRGSAVRSEDDCKVSHSKDTNTYLLALAISDELESLTGCKPYVVYNKLKRSKVDANREPEEGVQGIGDVTQDAYDDYHHHATVAANAVENNCGQGIYMDVHGQSHSANWTEFGYLLSKTQLNDHAAQDGYADDSSLTLLAPAASSFSHLLKWWGNYMTTHAGARAVPSDTYPGPGTESYYSGGYLMKKYRSAKLSSIQMEVNYHFRGYKSRRNPFAAHVAKGFVDFFQEFYNVDLTTSCGCGC